MLRCGNPSLPRLCRWIPAALASSADLAWERDPTGRGDALAKPRHRIQNLRWTCAQSRLAENQAGFRGGDATANAGL